MLRQAWSEALRRENITGCPPTNQLVDAVFAARTGSYLKAAIVQAVGKATDVSLNAKAVQKGGDDPAAWDARSFAARTFVRWNDEANRPFNHSADPYVSNPLRIPYFDDAARQKAKDKDGFDALVALLDYLNQANEPKAAYDRLIEVLLGLRRYLSDKSVDYPLPKRASLDDVQSALGEYLKLKSGGARLQAVVAALFVTLQGAGLKIGDVATGHVNAPDVGTMRSGDVEFLNSDGIVAVEVKDRPLTKEDFLTSVEKARIAGTTELMFVVRGDPIFAPSLDPVWFGAEAKRQFASGLNLYVECFDSFSRIALSLVGERARQRFLREVGVALESQSAAIEHKWAWAEIVKNI